MTKEEMDDMANEHLSDNFDGDSDYDDIDTVEYFDGSDDDYLDFSGGAKNFASEKKSDKRFRFTAKNTTDQDQVIVLTPGSFPVLRTLVPVEDGSGNFSIKTIGGEVEAVASGDAVTKYDNPEELKLAGFPIDAVLDDGIIYKDATGIVSITAPDTSRVRFFREYLKSNPSRVVKMSFTSTDKAFFDTPVVLQEASPYKKNGEDRIELQDYFEPGQFQDNKIVVTKGFQLDDVTVAYMTLPAGTTVSATLNIGAVERKGLGLKRKAERSEKKHGKRRRLRVFSRRRRR